MSSATENQAQKRAHAEENDDDAIDAKFKKVENGQGKYESAFFNMITTPEIICVVFSFLDKDQIERIQLVNRFWNNVIIRHKYILPLRQFVKLEIYKNLIDLYATEEDWHKHVACYKIKLNGTNLNKTEGNVSFRYSPFRKIKLNGTNLNKTERNVSFRYSQLTVDEVLTNLNDVVFSLVHFLNDVSTNFWNYLLNMMKLVTTKTGSRFRGKRGCFNGGRFGSKLNEIVDNYIIVDELDLGLYFSDSYIREICANPEIVQLPSTPKEIRLRYLEFKENEEVLHFTCNGKLNGANRLTIQLETSDTNYENFIRQWFELYRTHGNPISLVGKFEVTNISAPFDRILDAVKRFLNNTQLRVKYSLDEFHRSIRGVTYQYLKRSCVLHETDSYALVIEMVYRDVTDMSSINASDLDQPSCNKMERISLCVKSL